MRFRFTHPFKLSETLAHVLLLGAFFLTGTAPVAAGAGPGCDPIAAPAATLLFPYLEADLADSGGRDTALSIRSAAPPGSGPVLAHAVLWTDWGVPVLAFNLYLEEEGVVTFTLRDLLARGVLPETGPAEGGNPVPGCDNPLRLPTLDAERLEHLQAAFTGRPSPFDGLCYGAERPDDAGLAVAYLTVDVLDRCPGRGGAQVPGDVGYFESADTPGIVAERDVLSGDFFLLDPRENSAQGFAAIGRRIHGATYEDKTFYSELTGESGVREPLESLRQARFLDGGIFDGGTDLLIWKDGYRSGAVDCGTSPRSASWLFGRAWNESGGQETLIEDRDEVDLRVRRIRVGEAPWTPDAAFGTLQLQAWQQDPAGGIIGVPVPRYRPAQLWAASVLRAGERFSVGLESPGLDRLHLGGRGHPTAAARTGASLFMPYFEVDLDDPEGPTALLAIGAGLDLDNSDIRLAEPGPAPDSEPVLAHVVVWSEWGLPVLDFDILVPSNGVRTLNLREILARGAIPRTGCEGDPECEMAEFPGCLDPLGTPELDAAALETLRARLLGQPDPESGLCWSTPRQDSDPALATGFVTVDAVHGCSETARVPGDTGYFGEGGLARTDNVLWGDILWVTPRESSAQGLEVIALPIDPDVFEAHTFYGLWSGGADLRRALPWRQQTRFLDGGLFEGGTDLIFWLEPMDMPQPLACEAALDQVSPNRYFTLHPHKESGERLESLAVSFGPRLVRRVHVGGPDLPIEAQFGILSTFSGYTSGGVILPESRELQGWMIPVMRAGGRFSAAQHGTSLSGLLCPSTP